MPVLNNDKTSWNLYLSAIENGFLNASQYPANQAFQPLAILQRASWDVANAPNFDRFVQADMLNNLPNWGGFGVIGITKLSDVYGDFLQTLIDNILATLDLSTLTPAQTATINNLKADQATNAASAATAYSQAKTDWTNYCTNNGTDPNNIYLKNKFFETNPNYLTYAGFNNRANYDASQIFLITSAANPDSKLITAASMAYANTSYQLNLPQIVADENNSSNYVPVYSQSLNFDINTFKNGTLNQSLTIDSTTVESTTVETKWGGSFGVSVGFFSIGGSANSDNISKYFSQNSVNISIAFSNIGSFAVARGGWFKGYAIDKLGHYTPQYFGVNGKLAVIPVQVVVVKGPSITITVDNTTASLVENHFSSGGSFGIGPFNFGGGYSSDYIHSSFQNNGNSFTISATGNDAYILGWISYLPNYPASGLSGSMSPQMAEIQALSKRESVLGELV